MKPDFVVISPEEPLAAGVVDQFLQSELGISSAGPLQVSRQQLESINSFAAEIFSANDENTGNPELQGFRICIMAYEGIIFEQPGGFGYSLSHTVLMEAKA